MTYFCRGIRGATTAEVNTREAILEATRDMLERLITENGLRQEDIASAIFSTTPDLNAEFPAVAARALGWLDTALICAHEMIHVYIRGARNLRPERAHLSHRTESVSPTNAHEAEC